MSVQVTDECPLLEKCAKVSGIDCRGRDYNNCALFLRLTYPIGGIPSSDRTIEKIREQARERARRYCARQKAKFGEEKMK